MGGLQSVVDPVSIFAVFVMILPVAFFLAAAELAISLFARSFKEAQSYLTPLMFAVILPAVASMTPGIELNWKLAWIPILNTSLACKEIMSGTWPWVHLGVIFLSTWIYAGLALFAAIRLFQKEEVILRS
jgi:sodium transport system permease protein